MQTRRMAVQEPKGSGQDSAYRDSDSNYIFGELCEIIFDKYGMSKYRPVKYRQIYEKYYGAIPREQNGKSYDIHHIDGNHNNNEPTNLKAITVQEHYDIHYFQKDWKACLIMTFRLKSSPEEISDLAKKNAQLQIENGTHPFLGGEISRKHNQRRLADGTHHLLGGEIQRRAIANGTHAFAMKATCQHCGKTGQKAGMSNFHFDRCKFRLKSA